MPIDLAIDHAKRMVTGTAHGTLQLRDVEDYLDGLARTATMSYRKLLDLTRCSSALSDADHLALGARFNSYRNVGSMGPAAVVVGSEEMHGQIETFGSRTASRRPFRVFREIAQAERWLRSIPLKPSPVFDGNYASEAPSISKD